MVERKTWEEFRNTGLLLFINNFLHIFGWAVVIELDGDENIINAYPARVKFRGFAEDATSDAFKKLSRYMTENSEILYKDELKSILYEKLTDEFLSTLVEAVKVCGWQVDHIESSRFVDWCFDVANRPYLDLTTYLE